MNNTILTHTFWIPFLDCCYFLDPNMCGFQYIGRVPDPSGQLAELIAYINSTRVNLYSHQILFPPYPSGFLHLCSYYTIAPVILKYSRRIWVKSSQESSRIVKINTKHCIASTYECFMTIHMLEYSQHTPIISTKRVCLSNKTLCVISCYVLQRWTSNIQIISIASYVEMPHI